MKFIGIFLVYIRFFSIGIKKTPAWCLVWSLGWRILWLFGLKFPFAEKGNVSLQQTLRFYSVAECLESNVWVHHLTVALVLLRSAGGRRLRERKGPSEAEGLRPAGQAPEDPGTRLLTKRATESSSHLEKICELKIQPRHQGWKRCFTTTRAGLKIYVRKPQTWWAALVTIRQWNCESRQTWTTRLSLHLLWGWASAAQGPRTGQIALLTSVASSCQCLSHTGVFCRERGPMGTIQFVSLWTKPSVKRQAQNFINLNINWSEFWILFMGEKKLVN